VNGSQGPAMSLEGQVTVLRDTLGLVSLTPVAVAPDRRYCLPYVNRTAPRVGGSLSENRQYVAPWKCDFWTSF